MSVQLGKDIAAARHKAKLSGRQLAERVGVSDGWVRQLETGRMKKPDAQKLAAVAIELGLSVHTMLAMTDQLGAVIEPPKAPTPDADVAAAIREQTAVLVRQTEVMERQAAAAVAQIRLMQLMVPAGRAEEASAAVQEMDAEIEAIGVRSMPELQGDTPPEPHTGWLAASGQ